MHLMNDARAMVRVWGEGFLPYASQGRGKVIVEGYQEMQRDGKVVICSLSKGIRFPPAPNEDENKWVPMVTAPTHSSSRSTTSYNSRSEPSSGPAKRVQDLDPKELYRNVKKLLAKLEEEGVDFFENAKAKSIVEDSKASQKALMVMIDRETTRGDDENVWDMIQFLAQLLNRLLTLNDMCQQLSKMYDKYQRKLAEEKKRNDGWSDDEPTPKQSDDWSDEENPKRKPRREVAEEPSVQVRSTRRRPAKVAAEEEEKPQPTKAVSDDLLGLGLWDEGPAAPASPPAPAPAPRSARKPTTDDWEDDEVPAPTRKPARKVRNVDDLFDDDEEVPAPRKPMKKVSTVDDLFDDDDEVPAPTRKPVKKVSKVDDLFDDDDEPAPAPARKPKSRKPADDDWGESWDEPAPAPRARAPKAAPAPAPAPEPAFDPFSGMGFDFTAAKPAPAPAPKTETRDVFDDLFSMQSSYGIGLCECIIGMFVLTLCEENGFLLILRGLKD